MQHPTATPTDQLDDDRFEGPARLGEAVFDALGALRRFIAHDEPIVGELGEAFREKGWADAALMLRQGTGPGSTPPDATVYLGGRRQRRTIAAIFSGALTRLEELYSPVAAAFGALQVPVLVGWGDRDPFFPVEQAERTAAVSDARLRVFDGAGHFLPHECPIDVAQEIAAFTTVVNR